MISFLTRLFAVVGFLLVLMISSIIGFAYYNAGKPKPEPKSIVLQLPLDEAITEQSQPSPIDFAFHQETPHSLYNVLRAIEFAKNDPNVKAIVAHFGSGEPSLTQDQEIRAALAKFRESGKPTYAFASSYGEFGAGDRAYYLASAFDNIWVQPYGSVSLTGLAVQMPFAKTALAKLGVEADFLKREEYKSAMDNVTRDEFAPWVKVETQAMIENLQDQLAGGIGESLKMKPEDVKQLMANGPYTDDEALKAKLVTHIGYDDELEKEIDAKAGKDSKRLSVEDYLALDHCKCQSIGTKVALIYGEGVIVDHAEGSDGVTGETEIGADQISQAFHDAAEAPEVKAILFRVDSPGGSPEASETIRRAITQAQKKGKPVIVSMGAVAASGGYWVSMNADRIIAEPGTLTGSIGVFAGKMNIGGVLKKFDVNWETLRTTDTAGMWSMLEDFTPPQRARIDALLDQTYHAFVTKVSEARKIPIDKMPDIAKGRVFTGDQAIKIGLVDQLGGYDAAYDALRDAMKLDKKAPLALQQFPAPETPLERLRKALKGVGVEGAALGPFSREWQKVASLIGFAHQISLHPVELISPEAAFMTVK